MSYYFPYYDLNKKHRNKRYPEQGLNSINYLNLFGHCIVFDGFGITDSIVFVAGAEKERFSIEDSSALLSSTLSSPLSVEIEGEGVGVRGEDLLSERSGLERSSVLLGGVEGVLADKDLGLASF